MVDAYKQVFIFLSMRITCIPNLALTLSHTHGCTVRLGLDYTHQKQENSTDY